MTENSANAANNNDKNNTNATNNSVSFIGNNAIDKLSSAIKQIAPIGAGVLLICDQNIFEQFGIVVERILRRANYIIQRDCTLVQSGLNKKVLDAFVASDGVRCVVSVGGGKAADAAKYIAHKLGLALAIVATNCATISYKLPVALINDDGFFVEAPAAMPQIYVADYGIISTQSSAHLASGFGELTSRFLSVFEKKFCCMIDGKPLCNNMLDAADEIIDSVLTALKGYTKGVSGVMELVIDGGERLCALANSSGSDFIFCGADGGFCASVAMLFLYENRVVKMWGENEFALSRILAKVYRGILESDECFMPPPNNNKRINALKEYYGIDEIIAAKHISRMIMGNDLQLKTYRLNEYKQELFSAITQTDELLEDAYKIFKRLYDDDGFSLINYIDSADAQIAIALAPDCMAKNTMLNLLKHMGYLEKYIV